MRVYGAAMRGLKIVFATTINRDAGQGFGGAGVLEAVENLDGDTYRAVYTVKIAGIVYVLHVFQKKSKKSIPAHRSRTSTDQEAAEAG